MPSFEIYWPLWASILSPLGKRNFIPFTQYLVAPFSPGINPDALHEIVPPTNASCLLVGSTG